MRASKPLARILFLEFMSFADLVPGRLA